MSRSYRHNLVCVDPDSGGFKKIANKAVRLKMKNFIDEDGEPYVLNYSSYRKLYDSWLIHDYKSSVDANYWCEDAESDEEFDKLLGEWKRLWYYK